MDLLKHKNTLTNINTLAQRSIDIRLARAAFPRMEIGAAYKKWKESNGETPTMLSSRQNNTAEKEKNLALIALRTRQCDRPACSGKQYLEPICSSCVEGKAGYKSKWTCDSCMSRVLSKEGFDEWILKLSSG